MSELDPDLRKKLGAAKDAETVRRQGENDLQLAERRRLNQEKQDNRSRLRRIIPFAAAISQSAIQSNIEPNVEVVRQIGTSSGLFRKASYKNIPLISGWKIARYLGFQSDYESGGIMPWGIYSGTIWNAVSLGTDGLLYAYAISRGRGPTAAGFDSAKAITLDDHAPLANRTVEVVRDTKGTLDFIAVKQANQYPLPTLINGEHGRNTKPLFCEPATIEKGLLEFVVRNNLSP